MRELDASDLVVHAGDFVALSVLEELRSFGPVYAVHGNVDDVELRTLLPERRVVEVGEVQIGVVHDGGPRVRRPERLAQSFAGCAAVVFGHSHLPELDRHGDVWILNPGSPTERRRAPRHTMIRLEVEGGEVRPLLLDLDARANRRSR